MPSKTRRKAKRLAKQLTEQQEQRDLKTVQQTTIQRNQEFSKLIDSVGIDGLASRQKSSCSNGLGRATAREKGRKITRGLTGDTTTRTNSDKLIASIFRSKSKKLKNKTSENRQQISFLVKSGNCVINHNLKRDTILQIGLDYSLHRFGFLWLESQKTWAGKLDLIDFKSLSTLHPSLKSLLPRN